MRALTCLRPSAVVAPFRIPLAHRVPRCSCRVTGPRLRPTRRRFTAPYCWPSQPQLCHTFYRRRRSAQVLLLLKLLPHVLDADVEEAVAWPQPPH